ncbi:MAG: carboxylesterase family protein [Rhodothermales bacterium]|nr:carboxylesterase family protein [Rhodothermales bacterium]
MKDWLGRLAAGMFFIALAAGCASPGLDRPFTIETGTIVGAVGSDPSVHVFKGIPFAAAPTGDLRWRAPQPPRPWMGVHHADTFGASCIQNIQGSRVPWTEEFMVQGEISEDCLFLNIWTGAESARERRPVLVYIHGGGFSEGSGDVKIYDGEALAKKGIVVVTVNYRMGVLGFMAHPELTAEAGASGNYGLMDQVAALEWVKRNIGAFGGDPDRVTVAGQSAGAFSVHYLTASPMAAGLFHRAILQSGPGTIAGIGRLATPARETAEGTGLAFAKAYGADSLAALRALSWTDLTTPREGAPPAFFWPIIDGAFLTEDVPRAFQAGRQHDVPTLAGFNADEGSAFMADIYHAITPDAFATMARSRFGDRAEDFLALYPAGSDSEATASVQAYARESAVTALIHWSTLRAATAKTPSYLYYFERAIPWPEHPEFGAFHTGEVPYVFNNLSLLNRNWEASDSLLADQASSYWANFASAADPNGAGLPAWPAFGAQEEALMNLGVVTAPRPLPDQARLDFFLQLLDAP